MLDDPKAIVQRKLPGRTADQTTAFEARYGPYDERYVLNPIPDFGAAADEGSYFTVNNGQTGIANAAAPTSFSATNPFLLVYNKETGSNAIAKRIIMDYLALLNTVIGTGGASVQFAITLDQGNRYTSGGTDLSSLIVNPNGDEGGSSIAKVYAGNIVAAAASGSVRTIVGNRYMKGAIPVAGDQYSVKFGGVDAPSFIGISTILCSLNNVPKVIIPANWSMLLHLWLPSQSAASSYAPELGWLER